MAFGKPDAGKPPVRFDEGRSVTVFGRVPLNPFAPPTLRALVKLNAMRVGVPPVELDGSRPKAVSGKKPRGGTRKHDTG